MMDGTELIKRIRAKILALTSCYQQELSKRKQLEEECRTLYAQLKEKEIQIASLEERNKKLQLATAFRASSVDAQEAKVKIGKIVREIDRCVALLNR